MLRILLWRCKSKCGGNVSLFVWMGIRIRYNTPFPQPFIRARGTRRRGWMRNVRPQFLPSLSIKSQGLVSSLCKCTHSPILYLKSVVPADKCPKQSRSIAAAFSSPNNILAPRPRFPMCAANDRGTQYLYANTHTQSKSVLLLLLLILLFVSACAWPLMVFRRTGRA